ncbi:MAG: ATP synthase F0 subunit B [Dehalococcoidia bacterium]|nr:ATP synthase F0 subunit B [Dehalococcoidia bacterium]
MAELGLHLPSLIIYLVNFLILMVLLYFIGYKRILKTLDDRAGRIRGALEESERVKKQAEQAQVEMRQQLETSRQGTQVLMEQARQMAEKFREEEMAKARAESEAFLQRARQQIQQERDAAVEELRGRFADLAITAAERVVGRTLDKNAHKDLIDKVLQDSGQVRRG